MHGRGEVFISITNLINISSTSVNNTNTIRISEASFKDKDYKNKL